MTQQIREWILGIAGASLIAGAAVSLLPKGKSANAARFAAGLLVLIMTAAPMVRLGGASMAELISEYKAGAGSYGSDIAEMGADITARIIQAEAATYILDKAKELGIEDAEVRVFTRREEKSRLPYPYAAQIKAQAEEEKLERLRSCALSELGIETVELIR
ncbi:MAG: hypothetical protein II784_01090 [Oscillospiraceae bacterium]|nr:hypothetical protein [Oscillospiraceae bacterium]